MSPFNFLTKILVWLWEHDTFAVFFFLLSHSVHLRSLLHYKFWTATFRVNCSLSEFCTSVPLSSVLTVTFTTRRFELDPQHISTSSVMHLVSQRPLPWLYQPVYWPRLRSDQRWFCRMEFKKDPCLLFSGSFSRHLSEWISKLSDITLALSVDLLS